MYNEFVYVLKAGPFFKIGKTNNIDRRISQLSIQLPFPIELFKVINTDDGGFVESTLHHIFDGDRANGEWFELTPAHIADVFLLPGSMPVRADCTEKSGDEWFSLLKTIEDHIIFDNFLPSVLAGMDDIKNRI